MRQMALKLENISKTFKTPPHHLEVLRNINLEIFQGETVCLLGHSGCGKSTLLQIVAGLEPSTEGRVHIKNSLVTRPNQQVSLIFAKNLLFPWLDVAGNVALGLNVRGVSQAEARIASTLALVGLAGFEQAMPASLSASQTQQVALARAIVNRPEALLLDDPFSKLDPFARLTTQDSLAHVLPQIQTAALFVTRDIEEAVFLGNRIVIMAPRPGHITHSIEVPLPHPRDRHHADFLHIRRQVAAALGHQPQADDRPVACQPPAQQSHLTAQPNS
jgi:sulfonate transport system ATP-binding protein